MKSTRRPESQPPPHPSGNPGRERIYGSGEMAERIRDFDWSSTPLGPISSWGPTLVITVNSLLANRHPHLLFWGEDMLQIYNDAVIPMLGPEKHPRALGIPGQETWAEIWNIVGPQLAQAKGGEPFWVEDQLAPLNRDGEIKDAWFTYSYSPVRDADGAICGVLITTLETTKRVLAERALRNEQRRLLSLFEQAPVFFAVLRGPEHVFEMVNDLYLSLVGGRAVLGKSVARAIPEAEEQGFVRILDRVYFTGEPFTGKDILFKEVSPETGAVEERYLDFVYQPLREVDGSISGILVLGSDNTGRKRATEALIASQRSAANILGSITDGFQLLDSEGRFAQFNDVARAIYRRQGIDPDSLLGKPILTALPGLEGNEAGRAILKALGERQTAISEVLYLPWDRWFNVRHYPTPDGGVATFFQDITERKETERLLKEQRERFNFATEAAQIGYWFCDLPFDKLVWDNTVKEHFWLPSDAEVDIVLFYDRLHPDDREPTRKAIEESIANHTRYDVEYRTIAPDRRQKWIRANGRTGYDQAGNPIHFDGVTQDVTALKQALGALDSERRRLAAVFENVPVGLVFVGPSGRIVSGNAQADRLLEKSAQGNVAESYQNWIAYYPDGRELKTEEHPVTLALNKGGIHRGEFVLVQRNGVRTWVEFIATPIRDSLESVIGAVVAIADIDARKRAEEALIRSEKLAVVGRLAATISHEINNPLEAVTNLLYLIHENTAEPDTRSFSQSAQDELARVSHIVTHTLRFNRQTNGAIKEKLSDVLETSVAIYDVRLRNAGISLRREYSERQRVLCFGSELRQVFANLIGNSFDATRHGGWLRLRTRDQTNWKTGERGVRVTIADTGHGIDKQVQKRLFEPFFTTKGDSGTGLGLWVSREILQKHHAAVSLRSSNTRGSSGTVFSIWFPLAAKLEREAGQGFRPASLET